MKTHRLKAPMKKGDHEHARQQLREFADFIERQDPTLLAASVAQIESTLEVVAKIDRFFRAYVVALAARRMQ